MLSPEIKRPFTWMLLRLNVIWRKRLKQEVGDSHLAFPLRFNPLIDPFNTTPPPVTYTPPFSSTSSCQDWSIPDDLCARHSIRSSYFPLHDVSCPNGSETQSRHFGIRLKCYLVSTQTGDGLMCLPWNYLWQRPYVAWLYVEGKL